MRVLLTHPDYGQPYRRSCRAGLLTSIYTKGGTDGGDNKIHAKIELLLCFCQLGGGFDTDVIFHQGHYLVDGNARVDRTGNLDVFDTHEFNEDGLTMCKELRRRALAHCIRALDDQSSASQKLPTCMSLFDHLAGLVKHESHITRTAFKPVFEKNWPTSLIDDLIAHETATLGLHHASMRAPLPQGGEPGRTLTQRGTGALQQVSFQRPDDMPLQQFIAMANELVRSGGSVKSFLDQQRRSLLAQIIARNAQFSPLSKIDRPAAWRKRFKLLEDFWTALLSDAGGAPGPAPGAAQPAPSREHDMAMAEALCEYLSSRMYTDRFGSPSTDAWYWCHDGRGGGREQ
jgi:hypothetical protein